MNLNERHSEDGGAAINADSLFIDDGHGSPIVLCGRNTREARSRGGRALPMTAALVLVVLLLVVLLLLADFVAHRGWLRRRDYSLDGRLVLITGAAGGLGRQLALAFALEGAALVLWDIRRDALDELCRWLAERGVPASAIDAQCVDVADAAAVEREAEALRTRRSGPVHVVVNNAAVVHGQPLLGSGASAERLQRALDVNVAAHLWTARAFVPRMLDEAGDGGGVLVTVGSIMGSLPAAGLAEYCASKAAVGQLHACLRWELRRRRPAACGGVRCLLVRPYMIDTPLFDGGAPLRLRWLRRLLPPLDAADVARCVVRAVQTRGQEELVLPWHVKWLPPLLELLPRPVRDAALDVAGAECAMDTFRGRGSTDWQSMGGVGRR